MATAISSASFLQRRVFLIIAFFVEAYQAAEIAVHETFHG
jgi:hypothetical protein